MYTTCRRFDCAVPTLCCDDVQLLKCAWCEEFHIHDAAGRLACRFQRGEFSEELIGHWLFFAGEEGGCVAEDGGIVGIVAYLLQPGLLGALIGRVTIYGAIYMSVSRARNFVFRKCSYREEQVLMILLQSGRIREAIAAVIAQKLATKLDVERIGF